ncbi:hypothetical protein F5Y11DRAFT_309369 [Daldinia sp. FL1419]|nr:hypothetical protein F5Y11DRAFT_309369 [Daldinia sp. FL1419]
MEPTTPYHQVATARAEKIAALYFLHPIPLRPFSNPVTDIHRRSEGYTLSFEEERSLCSALAFIAQTGNDSNIIPAVCLEEGAGATYLNVLLAVNKHGHNKGDQILERLGNQFNKIFSLLANVDGSLLELHNNVFEGIISMCSDRIYFRLGLVPHNRGNQKTSIEDNLQIALRYLKNNKSQRLPSLPSFIDKADELVRLIQSSSKLPGLPELAKLVDSIYRLRRVKNLRGLLESIPEKSMQSSLRIHLINTITKVSRYRRAAVSLCWKAQNIPLVRRMRLVPVCLPREEFNRGMNTNFIPNLTRTVENNLGDICRLLKSSEKKVDKEFVEQTRKTLREAKIHAEIQLLYRCESNKSSDSHSPRVVCSSKDTCWLCNEFILMYEKIHTPKCHGRLYPGWRLPVQWESNDNDLATRYNARLEGHISTSLGALFRTGMKISCPEPIESSSPSWASSFSTLCTVASTPLNAAETPNANDGSQDNLLPLEEPTHRQALIDARKGKRRCENKEEIPDDASSAQNRKYDEDPKQLSKINATAALGPPGLNLKLELGGASSKKRKMGEPSPPHNTKSPNAQTGYAEGSGPGKQDRRRKPLSRAKDVNKPRTRKDPSATNAQSPEGETEDILDGSGCCKCVCM